MTPKEPSSLLLAQRTWHLNGKRFMKVMTNLNEPPTYQDHLANHHQTPIELQHLRHMKYKMKKASQT